MHLLGLRSSDNQKGQQKPSGMWVAAYHEIQLSAHTHRRVLNYL